MFMKSRAVIASLFLVFVLAACTSELIVITGAKTATGIDEKFMPVQATDVFPAGTKNVFCWFQWQNAKIGTKVTARWHFVTDNIHILDYAFIIPRRESSGSVSLSMPEGKTLPAGLYKVDLTLGEHRLKSLTFKIE